MRRIFPAFARISPTLAPLAFAAACLLPARAHAGPAATLEERYHRALSEVSQEVKAAEDPAEKRRILQRFLDHMQDGLGEAGKLPGLSDPDRNSLHTVLGKYYAYEAELKGDGGYRAVPDADLDAFAGYIRQDMEQAPVGGGVYISAGALLVILLILLLLF